MRILYSHRIQSRDGQSVHVEELISAFRAAGHEVTVAGPRFYDRSGFGGESKAVARWRRMLPGALGEFAELAYTIPACWRLWRAWRRFRPDFIYERCNLYYLAGTFLARYCGARLFLEVNSPLAEERAQHGGLKLKSIAARLEHLTWRSAEFVLPVTGVLGTILEQAGVERERIVVVPNGIVPERFTGPFTRVSGGEIILGFVGFVRAWHGLDVVLDGMARAEGGGVSLLVIGEGPARAALESQATSLGLNRRVRFTGLVPHEQVPVLLKGVDIALQPTVTPYASPLKIFDYMAAGCAIVAPDQPNIREILTNRTNALLFEPDNKPAMWHAISELVHDPVLRQRLGAAARQTLLTRDYTWRGNAARIIALAEGSTSQ